MASPHLHIIAAVTDGRIRKVRDETGQVLAPARTGLERHRMCARTGFDRSASIADTMAKQMTGLQEAKPQVDVMLASLEGLTRAEGDMRPAFKKFSETLDETEKAAARARKSRQTIREKEAEYFAEWQRQAAEITNPQIKAATQARQAEVKANLGRPQPDR